MNDFGPRAPGKNVGCAFAIWQMGNVLKHGTGQLHGPTEKVAKELGFSSCLLNIPENEGEEELRQMALREVAYTLSADSIERMALQLGCGSSTGLMPLYEHVESWCRDIDRKLSDEQEALKNLG